MSLPMDHWRHSGLSVILLEENGFVLLQFVVHGTNVYTIHKVHFSGDLEFAIYKTKDSDEALEKFTQIACAEGHL